MVVVDVAVDRAERRFVATDVKCKFRDSPIPLGSTISTLSTISL